MSKTQDNNSLSHTICKYKYYVVFAPKCDFVKIFIKYIDK